MLLRLFNYCDLTNKFCNFVIKTNSMPSVSNKGLSMPESPIRKLVPFAEKAYKQNKKVYHTKKSNTHTNNHTQKKNLSPKYQTHVN